MNTVELLPYDAQQVELGLSPWSSIKDFTDTKKVVGYRLGMGRALRAVNNMALDRFLDPAVDEADFERPFIFFRESGQPYNKSNPPAEGREDVVIAMDALYEFLAVGILDRSIDTLDTPDVAPYWKGVGAGTLRVLTQFVNEAVSSSTGM